MKTEPLAAFNYLIGLALLLLAGNGFAGTQPCLDSACTELMGQGGGLTSGTCAGVGQFIMVSVESVLDDSSGGGFELARARALRDLSAFFESDIEASEVVKEWERSSSVSGEERVESGSSYDARFSSSTDSILKGLQFFSSSSQGGKSYVTYILTSSSLSVANNLGNLLNSDSANKKNEPERLITVRATGIAGLSEEGLAPAREQAIAKALDQAVSQVLGVIVGSTVQAVNFAEVESEVFSHSVGFIESYRIIGEGRDDGNYLVHLQAVVTANKLYGGYQAYLDELDRPRFLVDTAGDKSLGVPFAEFVTGLGIELTDIPSDASYIIRLRAQFSGLTHPVEKIPGLRCTMNLSVLQADDRVEIFTLSNDPRKAVSFVGDRERQGVVVVEKAFGNLKTEFHESLNELIVDMARNGRRINLYFEASSNECDAFFFELQRKLDRKGGIRKASLVADEGRGLYCLRLRFIGDGSDLASLVMDYLGEGPCRYSGYKISFMTPSEIWFTTDK